MTSKTKVASTVSALRQKQSGRKKRPNISNHAAQTGIVSASSPAAHAHTYTSSRVSSTRTSVSASDLFTAKTSGSKREMMMHPHSNGPDGPTFTTTSTSTHTSTSATTHNAHDSPRTPTKSSSTATNINMQHKTRKTPKTKSKSTGNIMPKNFNSTPSTDQYHHASSSSPRIRTKPKINLHINAPSHRTASGTGTGTGTGTTSSKMTKQSSPKSLKSPKKSKSPKSSTESPGVIAKKIVKSLTLKGVSLKHGYHHHHHGSNIPASPSKQRQRSSRLSALMTDPTTTTATTSSSSTDGTGTGIIGTVTMLSPTSERVVMGDGKFDGIEIAMKECEYRDDDDDNPHGHGNGNGYAEVEMEVELMHVLGNNTSMDEMRGDGIGIGIGNGEDKCPNHPYYCGDGHGAGEDFDETSTPYNLRQQRLSYLSPVPLPGIVHDERVGMVDQHSTFVEYTRMSTRYHPTCDFTLQHRIPTTCGSITDPKGHGQGLGGSGIGSGSGHHNHLQEFSDKLAMLQKYVSQNEDEVVGKEWMHLCSEIKAIENESNKILVKLERMNRNSTLDRPGSGHSHSHSQRIKYHECTESNCSANYDINLYLDDSDHDKIRNRHVLSPSKRVFKSNHKSHNKTSSSNPWKCPDQEHRKYLQKRRGTHVLAGFRYPNHVKIFAMKCEGNMKAKGHCHKSLKHCDTKMYGIEKGSSKAHDVRHVAITVGDKGTASFFVSKDDGTSYHDDTLPQRLMQRIEKETMNMNVSSGVKMKKTQSNVNHAKSKPSNIRYLSCGPNESYYAELLSGHILWSIGRHDEQFQRVMKKMDVHRVAFGSFDTDTSWIVLAKDGRVIWRNIPCRLNQKLLSRTPDMPAPCEVSLGDEGAYFIRFLDGEIDYCLPVYMEEMVSSILQQGAEVTNIALHPESAHAFIIRHSMLPS